VLLSSTHELPISTQRLKCRHGEVPGVEVVEEEVEVMGLLEIREEGVVEEDNQSGKLEDKDRKKSKLSPEQEDYEPRNWLLRSTGKSDVD
jgi:hypothetical protein